MKAVFLDFATVAADTLDVSPLTKLLPELELFDHTPPALVGERIRDCEFVLTNKAHITRELQAIAPGLRFIGLTATGVDNVDIESARERGIAVCNIRGYCTASVVEHVFAVALQLARNVKRYDGIVREGRWQRAENFCMLDFPIRQLSAMTLGIVGLGELGGAVAAMARGFGMQVLVARRIGSEAVAGDDRVALDELLARADVVSLHCPLNEATRGMIGKSALDKMRPDAILVNTARGALVDTAALARALEEKVIGGAAIDVLPQEPPVDGDPLLDYAGNNLILTPHIAWATVEARQNAIDELAANVAAFLDGKKRNRMD